MPTQEDFSRVESLIREYSGEFTITELWEHAPEGISKERFFSIIKKFTDDRKIAIDRNGVIGWIWNPELTKKYREDSSLAIRL